MSSQKAILRRRNQGEDEGSNMEHKEQASAQPAESKEQVLRRQIMAIQRDASLDAKQKAERIQVEFFTNATPRRLNAISRTS